MRQWQLSSVLLLIAAVCASGANLVAGEPPPVDLDRPAAVPTPPRPEQPLTAADFDPDVAKRPRFLSALAKRRIIPRLSDYGEPNLPPNSIPADEWTEFRSSLEHIISQESLPDDWETVTNSVYGDSRGEPSIQVLSWELPLGTIMVSRSPTSRGGCGIRLQVAPDHRLVIRPATDADYQADRWTSDGKKFFDQAALHRLITSVLAVPFPAPEDFMIAGGTPATLEGVRVAVGSIEARTPLEEPTQSGQRPWYHSIPILITDSDPQYIGFGIDFRAEAKEHRTAP